jgi:hypothetical protein
MIQQPLWKKIGTLGDINPVDYGGGTVFQDTTGVYPAELEYVVVTEEKEGEPVKWNVYRAVLDRLRYRDGYLYNAAVEDGWGKHSWSDPTKEFYPSNYDEWFSPDLGALASFCGCHRKALINFFCSESEQNRAFAYSIVADYWGWDNLDSYPLQFTDRKELESFLEHNQEVYVKEQ